MADRYEAKLYAAHVIPPEAYAFASPGSIDRALKEAGDFAGYTLNQIIGSIRRRGLRCDALLGEGNVAEVLEGWVKTYCADLVVVGTISRAGWGTVVLGSVAEEVIREAPCPVLTVGPHVTTLAPAGVHSIVRATDFSPVSLRAVEFALSLACEYKAHLTLVHVMQGSLRDSPRLALQLSENRLREMIPYRPEVVVETGAVAERILNLVADLSADFIVIGVRGAGAFAQTASRFGSIAHRVLALAPCPVVTVGDVEKAEDDLDKRGAFMEPATIMVLVLCAGVAALLVWFEINSRRNEASNRQAAKPAQSTFEPLQKEAQSKAESEIEKKNAA